MQNKPEPLPSNEPGSNGTPRAIDKFLQDSQERSYWFYKPFWMIGGAMPELLKNFPEDWNKHFGTGATILMTAVFASISGGYAIATIFDDAVIAPFVFGGVWGLFILLLDRYFVTSIVKSPTSTFWGGFKIAWLRIVLAVLIGIVISRPLELRIAQPEIDIALDSIYTSERIAIINDFDDRLIEIENKTFNQSQSDPYSSKIKDLEERKTELQEEISSLVKRTQDLADNVQCECNGDCGTGIKGRGPACKFLEEEYKRAIADLNRIKAKNDPEIALIADEIREQQDSIASVKAQEAVYKANRRAREEGLRDSTLAQYDLRNRNSLINRNKVLHRLTKEDDSVWWMVSFLTFLFVFIETAPILIKLITNYGAYDAALATLGERGQQQARLDRNISKEEIKLNRILLGQISRAQQQILSEKVANWKQKNQLINQQEARRLEANGTTEVDENNEEDLDVSTMAVNNASPFDEDLGHGGGDLGWRNPRYDESDEV